MFCRKGAEELLSVIRDKYWDKDEDFLLEVYPVNEKITKYSFLWGYGALITMLSTFVRNTNDKNAREFLLKAMDKLELYKTDRNGFAYYDSHPKKFEIGEPYYDDNAWVVLALIETYKLTGDIKYFARAVATSEYLYFGWNDIIGGIYWREQNCASSNTCSCGPSIMCSALLYELTQDVKYLNWAIKIYRWTYENLKDKDGTYFDAKNNDGKIAEQKYTYNTGTMIYSGAKLYELTKDSKYLKDALESANGAFEYFFKKDNNDFYSLPGMPWFNVYLLQGFIELHRHTPITAQLKRFYSVLETAVRTGKTAEGLYYPSWKNEKQKPSKHQGLDDFGTAECLALMIPLEKELAG